MSLGDNIRFARINKKLQQKELAELLSAKGETVGNTTISNWENGTSKPDPDTIGLLCEILDVDANFLLDFENKNKEKQNKLSKLEQYKILLDSDPILKDAHKEFIMDFLTEQHKEIDKKINKE